MSILLSPFSILVITIKLFHDVTLLAIIVYRRKQTK